MHYKGHKFILGECDYCGCKWRSKASKVACKERPTIFRLREFGY